MGALDRYLEEQRTHLNVEEFISSDVEEMDNAPTPRFLYKYYPAARSSFFDKPKIRFTQKGATTLNDRFELTKRWREFASKRVRSIFAEHITGNLERVVANKGLVLTAAKEALAKEGVFLGPDQMAEAARILLSPEGNERYLQFIGTARSQAKPIIDALFDTMEANAEEMLAEMTSDIGIFSLSGDHICEPMWGLYGDYGKGFVVEFDTSHNFFLAENGRSRIRKVKYTQNLDASFLENPFQLFFMKTTKWSFEQEWRMIKGLSECDEKIVLGDDPPIYVCNVQPGMVRSVIFGYNCDIDTIADWGARMRLFDDNIAIKWAVANESRGEIEISLLLE